MWVGGSVQGLGWAWGCVKARLGWDWGLAGFRVGLLLAQAKLKVWGGITVGSRFGRV